MQSADPPEIFDYRRRRALSERAANRRKDIHFLWQMLAQELADRLALTKRNFENCLFLGPLADSAQAILGAKSASVETLSYAEEDRLMHPPDSFDLIISAGMLDSINDLPGALVKIRRTLRPDGLFLGAMFGAGSLSTLKRAMLQADGIQASQHIHPQIELRAAADLLVRAGFALPVADRIDTEVRYSDWRTLIADLRDAGIGNCLAGHRRFLGRHYRAALNRNWNELADADAKVREQFAFLYLSGWSPAPNQPKPAQRGSGQVSLAALFEKSSDV
jgi:SAM-dependent methyltransferase